jgi:hypothetical protein
MKQEPKFKVRDIVCLISHPNIPFVISKVDYNTYNGYEYTVYTVENSNRIISQLVPENILQPFHPAF